MGGYIIFLGNSPVSWAAKKHRGIQALSSTESEILQVVETTKELLWLQPLPLDVGIHVILRQICTLTIIQPDIFY